MPVRLTVAGRLRGANHKPTKPSSLVWPLSMRKPNLGRQSTTFTNLRLSGSIKGVERRLCINMEKISTKERHAVSLCLGDLDSSGQVDSVEDSAI